MKYSVISLGLCFSLMNAAHLDIAVNYRDGERTIESHQIVPLKATGYTVTHDNLKLVLNAIEYATTIEVRAELYDNKNLISKPVLVVKKWDVPATVSLAAYQATENVASDLFSLHVTATEK